MRKTILIAILVFLFFVLEFILFDLFGRFFMPNLLLLLVIFITLCYGVRFGLIAALLSGIMKDSFAASLFGIHVFSFIMFVYAAPIIKKHLYYASSTTSRLVLVLILTVLNVAINFFGELVFNPVSITQVFKFILFPQLLATLLVTAFVFQQLKICVSKFYV